MPRRGPYAKGIARRERLLTAALAVIARQGYRGASLKEIADEVGLSQTGLLHHFDSKEDLFVEVLRARDDADRTRALTAFVDGGIEGALDTFVEVMRANADVPGLVHLYTALAVEAADPAHAAHEYFVSRRGLFRAVLAGAVRQMQADGRIEPSLDADTLATGLHALADGLQLHFLSEPDLDMAGAVETMVAAVLTPVPTRTDPSGDVGIR
ncbi:DNA-binding transcriptional regulator, AcrR family [Paraoerskovia marina]|uniref:DNA-binding transcriptional regulator, AcrR family n=1 Tax=Paraoerskovia marina TaxID=545619 RepID=A0A1H1P5G5_9CELL|nr:TetR/AcrR family transcriptional regulator [Paraoerskovia marina]SDS06437.1 DNA-binding transcriptional regulator, AcrR family [Paraoerskovia marina]